MPKVTDVEGEVLRALKAIVPPRTLRSGVNKELRLREDLKMGSLALIAMAADLCERFGIDPMTLDMNSFFQRAQSVGDLMQLAEEVLRNNPKTG